MFHDFTFLRKLIIYFVVGVISLSEIKITTSAFHIPSDFVVIPRLRRETCATNLFKCIDGSCISSFLVCDGLKDCPDGSDEVLHICSENQCPKNTFRCSYGGCVDGDKKCNGQQDCADNSDELLLDCPGFQWLNDGVTKSCKNEFQCRNGDCIGKYTLCDGKKDCQDGTDETVTHCNTPFFKCPKESFQCGYGACVDSFAKCNGVVDCADGSDEDVYICNTTSNSVQQMTTNSRPITLVSTTSRPVPPPPETINHNCILPNSSPGTTFEHVRKDIMQVRCDDNFVLKFEGSPFIACINGQWSPSQVCVSQCKALKSISAVFSCNYRGMKVNCSLPVKPGTFATANCAPGYFDRDQFSDKRNVCLEDGNWEYEQYRCSEDCGIVYDSESVKPQISYGKTTTIAEFPWNVGIYQSKKGSNFRHICGGTLISAYTVLTAAHCVTNDIGSLNPKTELKIAVGKYKRDWDHETNATQKRDISKIFIPDEYQGLFSNFKYDIALIELNVAVILSVVIMPICIPLESEKIHNNQNGQIAGWGIDENNTSSEVLKSAVLPYLNRVECLTLVPREEEKVTEDKFCAAIKNGTNVTNVMQGDSGAGFVFEVHRRFYIHGIVSTKINNLIPAFTDVNYKDIRNFFVRTHQDIRRKHIEP